MGGLDGDGNGRSRWRAIVGGGLKAAWVSRWPGGEVWEYDRR
jgi:hypothetical protein